MKKKKNSKRNPEGRNPPRNKSLEKITTLTDK